MRRMPALALPLLFSLAAPPQVAAALPAWLEAPPLLGIFSLITGLVTWVFYFLFTTFWGWMILISVVFPLIGARLRVWGRRRAFYHANRALLDNPKDAGARFQLGMIHFEGRQLRRARRYFLEALEICETHDADVDPVLYRMLGHTLRRLGKPREALVSYEAGLEEAPKSGRGESETGIARCHLALGDPEAAEAALRAACEQNLSLLEPRLRLAAARARRGDPAGERAILEEARGIRRSLRAGQLGWRLLLSLYPLARPLL